MDHDHDHDHGSGNSDDGKASCPMIMVVSILVVNFERYKKGLCKNFGRFTITL